MKLCSSAVTRAASSSEKRSGLLVCLPSQAAHGQHHSSARRHSSHRAGLPIVATAPALSKLHRAGLPAVSSSKAPALSCWSACRLIQQSARTPARRVATAPIILICLPSHTAKRQHHSSARSHSFSTPSCWFACRVKQQGASITARRVTTAPIGLVCLPSLTAKL